MRLQHIADERVRPVAAVHKPTDRRMQTELRQAFDEGVQARRQGFPSIACWYPPGSEHHAHWLAGHAARPGGRYCVAGQRKHIAADAFPFAPGAVETHRAARTRWFSARLWLAGALVLVCVVVAIALTAGIGTGHA